MLLVHKVLWATQSWNGPQCATLTALDTLRPELLQHVAGALGMDLEAGVIPAGLWVDGVAVTCDKESHWKCSASTCPT